MDYRKFKMELLELVQKHMDEHVEISFERIPKNNGIFLEGMVFHQKERSVSPVIYMEEFYEFWQRGITLEQLVEKILISYRECISRVHLQSDFFRDYEKLKSHIYYKLIHYEKNRKLLEQIPHKRILDLAMVFYYRLEELEPMATVMIQNSHLQMWEITQSELEENAQKYTCLYMPATFLTMAQVMGVEEEELEQMAGKEAFPMYVLTNQERKLGAGVLFYPGILEQAEKLLGENFYILPSSIHECILIPEQTLYTQEELAEMVTEINENHVDTREVLSDQAYYYKKKDRRIYY